MAYHGDFADRMVRHARSVTDSLPDAGRDVCAEYPCKDCGTIFTLTVSEREFFEGKGLSIPKRCRSCRAVRKAAAIEVRA